MFSNPLAHFRRIRISSAGHRKPAMQQAARRRLALEPLEDRQMLTSFLVTNLGSVGPGSLNAAIANANNSPGPDRIRFDFDALGLGPHLIDQDQQLSAITDPVTIDGKGRIEVRGTNAVDTNGFVVASHDVTIRGMTITGFTGHGITIDSSDDIRGFTSVFNVVRDNGLNGINIAQPRVNRLQVVDDMVTSATPSESFSDSLGQADLFDSGGAVGSWPFDHSIPGDGGDDYGFVATGVLDVSVAGLYSFAIGNDDGARLRIGGDDVIVDDSTHPFLNSFGSIELDAGQHVFEWTGFELRGGSGFELSVAVGDVTGPPTSEPLEPSDGWKVVGDPTPAAEIELSGVIDIVTYYLNLNETASHEVLVKDTIASNNGRSGVFFERVNGSTVKRTTANGNGIDGIAIHRSHNNNVLRSAGFDNGRTGVRFSFSDGNHAKHVSTGDCTWTCIDDIFGQGNVIANSTVEGGLVDGVSSWGATNATFDNVTVSGIKGSGINVGNSSVGTVIHNSLSYDNGNGVTVRDSEDIVISRTTASRNLGNGVEVFSSNRVHVDRVLAAENAGHGFLLESSNGSMWSRNRSHENSGNGFNIVSSHDNELTYNRAIDNGGSGFLLDSGSGNTLSDGVARRNSSHGFSLANSDNNELTRNKANRNGGMGFILDAILQNIFDDNQCKNNTLGGSNFQGICDS